MPVKQYTLISLRQKNMKYTELIADFLEVRFGEVKEEDLCAGVE